MVCEEWRLVPGIAGYEISDHGRVRSLDRVVIRSTGPMKCWGRILKPTLRNGYPRVRIKNNRYVGVHQLVALAFIGPCPNGHEVNHKNTVTTDSTPGNLEYVTRSQNQLHAIAHGLRVFTRGEKHHEAKATEKQVLRGYRLVAAGATLAEASVKTGMSAESLQKAILGVTWRHLGLVPLKRVGGRRKGKIYA